MAGAEGSKGDGAALFVKSHVTQSTQCLHSDCANARDKLRGHSKGFSWHTLTLGVTPRMHGEPLRVPVVNIIAGLLVANEHDVSIPHVGSHTARVWQAAPDTGQKDYVPSPRENGF